MDPYTLLGLEPGASEDEIRRAWKQMARTHHPDLNPDDPDAETRFKQIKSAYDALMSGEARRTTWSRGAPGASGPSAPDEAWFDAVEWMIEVRRREVMEQMMPRFVGRYGRGQALAWALRAASDLAAEAESLDAHPAPRWLRRLKHEVVLTEDPWNHGLAHVARGSDGRVQVSVNAFALWRRHRRLGADNDDALRRLVFATVDHGLATAVPLSLRLPSPPATLEDAQRNDMAQGQVIWFWRMVWMGVAVLGALMIGSAMFRGG